MPTVPDKDTTDVIQAALDEAGINAEGEIETDLEPEVEVEPEAPVVDDEPIVEDEPVAEVPADGELEPEADPEAEAAKAVAAKLVPAADEFDALCDELGFRAPKPGQKENKIPQSRVRARVKTALKKQAEKFGAERTELTGKATAVDTELQTFRRADAIIAKGATDPAAARQYIEMLAAIHPAYKAFLGAAPAAADTVPQSLKDLGPKPGPDIKYDDGTTGFSQEQLDKRDEWLAASAEIRGYERSKKEFEARFGPYESAHKADRARAEEAPRVAARIATIRDQWGELFIAQERAETAKAGSSDIAKYQAAHPGMPFEQVVAAVLLPLMRADRTTMRASILAELNGKKKVAKPSTGQATRAVIPSGPRSTTEVIEEELAKAGL